MQFEDIGHWNGLYVRVLGVWDGSELLCMSAAAVNFPTGEVRGQPACSDQGCEGGSVGVVPHLLPGLLEFWRKFMWVGK